MGSKAYGNNRGLNQVNLKAESRKSSLNSREKKHFYKERALGTDKKYEKNLTLMSSLFQERMSIVI